MILGFFAIFKLAMGTVVHFISKLIRGWPEAHHLQRLLDQYRPDHIELTSRTEKALLFQMSRCTACGLCDQICVARHVVQKKLGATPSQLIRAATRSGPERAMAYGKGPRLSNPEISAPCDCERLCPAHIPIHPVYGLFSERS